MGSRYCRMISRWLTRTRIYYFCGTSTVKWQPRKTTMGPVRNRVRSRGRRISGRTPIWCFRLRFFSSRETCWRLVEAPNTRRMEALRLRALTPSKQSVPDNEDNQSATPTTAKSPRMKEERPTGQGSRVPRSTENWK